MLKYGWSGAKWLITNIVIVQMWWLPVHVDPSPNWHLLAWCPTCMFKKKKKRHHILILWITVWSRGFPHSIFFIFYFCYVLWLSVNLQRLRKHLWWEISCLLHSPFPLPQKKKACASIFTGRKLEEKGVPPSPSRMPGVSNQSAYFRYVIADTSFPKSGEIEVNSFPRWRRVTVTF